MNTKTRFALVITLALIAGAALVVVTWAAPMIAPTAPDSAPTIVSYQGEVHVSGLPYSGDGYFKFAVVRALGTTTYWSNDGTSVAGSEPTAAVQLTVNGGLFSVLLGDTALGGMTQPLEASVFSANNRYLRVWFSTSPGGPFDQLAPDTPVAAVPYALQAQEAVNADTLDGFHASELGGGYQNVVVVAKSGTSFASVQAAIDSITDEAADNPYLVWVAPGVYIEQVTMKPFVHLQGAGQEATVISSTVTTTDWPPTQGTLLLASDTSLRELTLVNTGSGETNVALLATAGMTDTLVADVTAHSYGSGTNYHGITLGGAGTGIRLQDVTTLVEYGSQYNDGLVLHSGVFVVVQDSTFTARGGEYALGIVSFGSGTTLVADNVNALGDNGSADNYGLFNADGASATLHGGSFTGRGGTNPFGIANNDSGTTLDAEGVTALAENGTTEVYGFGNWMGATATVRGGSFTGRGGTNAYGIANGAGGTILYAESVFARAEDASSDNHGLFNFSGADATLSGGTFTGLGGTNAYGISNLDVDSSLNTESVAALAEDASSDNHGLSNSLAAEATLSGGTFTGRGGINAYGITNINNSTRLYAVNVKAFCEDGSLFNSGLNNNSLAEAALLGSSFTARGGTSAHGITNFNGSILFATNTTTLGENSATHAIGLANYGVASLRGGAFTGRGGVNARGIFNSNSSSVILDANSVTALGRDGSGANYGLYNQADAIVTANSSQFIGGTNGLSLESGSVQLGSSLLDGGATRSGGSLTCFQVYDESYAAYMCP